MFKVLLGSSLIILLILSGCTAIDEPKNNRRVRILQVEAEDLHPTLMFPGRSRPGRSVNLAFRVSGQMNEFNAIVGQEVKKGDVLAKLDPRDFELRVTNISGSLLQAEASLRLAEAEATRFSNLFQRDPGAVSEILVKQKQETVNNLLGQLKSTEATLDTAKRALEDTELKAPYNGTIVAIFVDNFEQINAGQFILRLISTEEIEVSIDVPDRIISSIKDAKNIHVQFDGVPGVRFSATIEEIGTEASQTTRTFPVTLLVIPPEGTYLFPGMTGTAFLEQSRPHGEQKETFKLPLSALLSQNGKVSNVWIADPSTEKISTKPVEIVTLAHQYAIVTGLNSNDRVVVSGVNFLNKDQIISPLYVRIDNFGEIFQLPDGP